MFPNLYIVLLQTYIVDYISTYMTLLHRFKACLYSSPESTPSGYKKSKKCGFRETLFNYRHIR